MNLLKENKLKLTVVCQLLPALLRRKYNKNGQLTAFISLAPEFTHGEPEWVRPSNESIGVTATKSPVQ